MGPAINLHHAALESQICIWNLGKFSIFSYFPKRIVQHRGRPAWLDSVGRRQQRGSGGGASGGQRVLAKGRSSALRGPGGLAMGTRAGKDGGTNGGTHGGEADGAKEVEEVVQVRRRARERS